MEKIASFTVNHIDLLRGIYVSRKGLPWSGPHSLKWPGQHWPKGRVRRLYD